MRTIQDKLNNIDNSNSLEMASHWDWVLSIFDKNGYKSYHPNDDYGTEHEEDYLQGSHQVEYNFSGVVFYK